MAISMSMIHPINQNKRKSSNRDRHPDCFYPPTSHPLTEHESEQCGADEGDYPEAAVYPSQVPSDRRAHDEAHTGDSVEPADDTLPLRGRFQVHQKHTAHGLCVLERSWTEGTG